MDEYDARGQIINPDEAKIQDQDHVFTKRLERETVIDGFFDGYYRIEDVLEKNQEPGVLKLTSARLIWFNKRMRQEISEEIGPEISFPPEEEEETTLEEVQRLIHELRLILLDYKSVNNGQLGKSFDGRNLGSIQARQDEFYFVVAEIERFLPSIDEKEAAERRKALQDILSEEK